MKKIFSTALLILPFCSGAQDETKKIAEIAQQLESETKSVSDVLTDPTYMRFHSLASFRQVISKNAKQEKITLANSQEPGTPVTINVRLQGRASVSNLLIYVYHTDNKGWYSDTAPHILAREGDRGHARLFGYLRSDKNGQLEFFTIHPQGYPNSDLPQHIHIEIFNNDGQSLLVTELLFDDDARLKSETRRRAEKEGFLIAKNEGKNEKQLYTYSISLK
jgi:protocatechuate 3,4-dioxygenase beta subunit